VTVAARLTGLDAMTVISGALDAARLDKSSGGQFERRRRER
jgi:hypothetical protein